MQKFNTVFRSEYDTIPACKDVVVAEDPIFPRDELPKGAEGGA